MVAMEMCHKDACQLTEPQMWHPEQLMLRAFAAVEQPPLTPLWQAQCKG
jgi:hypothetical protein